MLKLKHRGTDPLSFNVAVVIGIQSISVENIPPLIPGSIHPLPPYIIFNLDLFAEFGIERRGTGLQCEEADGFVVFHVGWAGWVWYGGYSPPAFLRV